MNNPKAHYQQYSATYDQIQSELTTLRESFKSADRFTQKVMLFDSTVYAVMSVQNSVSMLRRAFSAYVRADDFSDVRDACKNLNYGNNKFKYIQQNFDTVFSNIGDRVIENLAYGSPWHAVQLMVEHFDGVSYIKAPFVGCMLGFDTLMCIDTNVAQMVPDDSVKAKGYTSMGEYQEAIDRIKAEYPDVASEVSTFMLQWILFDVNRSDGVAKHEEWFDHMLPGTVFSRQTALDAF